MDKQWLTNPDKRTALMVPTRSLGNTLQQRFSDYQIAEGNTVWETPNIVTWGDYLGRLWQLNRRQFPNIHTLINDQQSLLLWTQVIEMSRRQERDLTLLNVQQTAKAAQRSWRLMHNWGVQAKELEQDHVADTDQFLLWLKDYHTLLAKRCLIDESMLQSSLIETEALDYPFKTLVWHSYDLITPSQAKLNELASQQGTVIRTYSSMLNSTQKRCYTKYLDTSDEVRAVLTHARALVEKQSTDSCDYSINIVIPDLQHRQTQVREIAREIFYPDASPLDTQLMPLVYRFSLGQPLNEWAAIETALSVIGLLKNRCKLVDVSFLLRNQFLQLTRQHREECRMFERWLKYQRVRFLLVDELPTLYQECLVYLAERNREPKTSQLLMALQRLVELRQTFQLRLSQQKEKHHYATLSFREWVRVFDQWLDAWGWSTETVKGTTDTVQYQLLQRWQKLLEEYESLGIVQSYVGLSRAIELIKQLSREAIFLPKAMESPIFISGIYEAIGRPAQHCFLTGMNNDYPLAPKSDVFIPNRLLKVTEYPEATPEKSYAQARKVIDSLLSSADSVYISYARQDEQDRDIQNMPSPFYRQEVFEPYSSNSTKQLFARLEPYRDTTGPALQAGHRARGGTTIFENQSVCAFKAFATHRLQFERDREAEFGLDGLDRGNIVHRMLDLAWANLQTQARLKELDEDALKELIDMVVDQAIKELSLKLNSDKQILIQHEKSRLANLLRNWLVLEAKRPMGFSVVEREEERYSEIGGIEFKCIIDRLDMTDDGRSLIIDYKTGAVARSDWVGERVAKPQMPLYAIALDRIKQQPVSGIAYAKVDTKRHEFLELCETNILKADSNRYAQRYAQDWEQGRLEWPDKFEQLAEQFLTGEASVNPLDEKVCQYCDLSSVCRIAQLKDPVLYAAESEKNDQ